MWPKKGDDDSSRSASRATQALAHLHQREGIPEPSAKPHERDSGRVLAPATIRAVVVRALNVCERGGFERRRFHAGERTASTLWIAWV